MQYVRRCVLSLVALAAVQTAEAAREEPRDRTGAFIGASFMYDVHVMPGEAKCHAIKCNDIRSED